MHFSLARGLWLKSRPRHRPLNSGGLPGRARCEQYLQMRALVFERQNGLCFYCGYPLMNAERQFVLDHLVPSSRGGPDGHQNRVAACRPCDSAKRNRLPTQAEREKQRGLLDVDAA